ncbi:MAG: hypothetical protein KDE22_18495, partial [Rhodobacterales bacterium]|nr:hypothetical protein [Rhodobacterales bacterium]
DPDRGHIFTDRLLHARGEQETMFMGAATIRPLLQQLLPEVQFDSRARFSTLRYTGPKKINRLPARSATVAFSGADVYAIAELLRRQRGGAAVVLGALSPRTRNAQVAMYQAGEVDYLVATDAIGMGLNMDVDHVAFAATRKFDGRAPRRLRPSELAQIAGRAGRHMNDGTFGTTAEIGHLDPDEVEAIENHRFKPLRHLFWRNTDLRYGSVEALRASLSLPPDRPGLVRAREADDELVLAELVRDAEVRAIATNPQMVQTLWDVCRIPDFGNVMSDGHARLLGRLYKLLAAEGRLPEDWMARQVDRIDRVDGGIEALAQRIANIRTWTYVAFHGAWLHDVKHWQERTRQVEDNLSDALHERLTQRFVDRRTSVLVKRMKERETLQADVKPNGDVAVEGHFVGRLTGFRFMPDTSDGGDATKVVTGAAHRALVGEITQRVARLERGPDATIALGDSGTVLWHQEPIARLAPGDDLLKPGVEVLDSDLLDPALKDRIRVRLSGWAEARVKSVMEPLVLLRDAELPAPARGLAFRLVESLGSLPRRQCAEQIEALGRTDRTALRELGVRIGRETVYLPALIKPAAAALRAVLWCQRHNDGVLLPPPPPGRVSVTADEALPRGFYDAVGYRKAGTLAVRIDILERLAAMAWSAAREGPFLAGPDFLSLAGCGADDMKGVLRFLGYQAKEMKKRPPAPEAPAPEALVPEAPAPEAQAPEAPAGEAPAETGPAAVESAPIGDAPIEDAPIEAPAETPVVEAEAVEDTPVEDAPVEAAPVATESIEEAPIPEAAPEEAAPEEAAPVEAVSAEGALPEGEAAEPETPAEPETEIRFVRMRPRRHGGRPDGKRHEGHKGEGHRGEGQRGEGHRGEGHRGEGKRGEGRKGGRDAKGEHRGKGKGPRDGGGPGGGPGGGKGPRDGGGKGRPREKQPDPDSPFAKLLELNLGR